jgi:Domain of unknown function (DUF4157)
MRPRRVRARRRQPSESQRPFFEKKGAEGESFFTKSSQVQRKLNIGNSSDPMEAEAESAAQKVTSQQQVQKAEKKEEEPVQKAEQKEEDKSVQKAEKQEEEKPVQKAEKKEEEKPQKAEKKEEEKPVQKAEKQEEEKPVQKAEKKEEEKPVQAKRDPQVQTADKAGDGGNHAQPSFETLLAQRKGRGIPLPDDVRIEMERKFGTNFRKVRIHNDPEASAMCETISAYAFAHGYDIYFQEGLYNPTSTDGKALLAHELAHVVQQNG